MKLSLMLRLNRGMRIKLAIRKQSIWHSLLLTSLLKFLRFSIVADQRRTAKGLLSKGRACL